MGVILKTKYKIGDYLTYVGKSNYHWKPLEIIKIFDIQLGTLTFNPDQVFYYVEFITESYGSDHFIQEALDDADFRLSTPTEIVLYGPRSTVKNV